MDINVMDEITELEKRVGGLSNTQKILLATDGSVTRILDVVEGEVDINTLTQEFQEADKYLSQKLNISEGDNVNYRVVVIGTDEPLIYAISHIPVDRLTNNFKEDLIRANIPIGRILKKHNVESRREIESVGVEKPDEELKKIFKTDAMMLTRTYNIIRNNEILIRIKETFPITSFNEN
ncbi:chorismate--pyruvate lyase family protein [Methanobacterium alcaliphilum]|uniref:chorismate--pyruvate lyase family protein n=1 Tax=Methanobacterium alcaliphilum TaxID=392018 RepID=UPI002009E2C1|nr:chorismate lyase [Methanobacterium alcaliphilum]MCK9152434.1 chorismate lyase [Methanobacterium alcaliphilum]